MVLGKYIQRYRRILILLSIQTNPIIGVMSTTNNQSKSDTFMEKLV